METVFWCERVVLRVCVVEARGVVPCGVWFSDLLFAQLRVWLGAVPSSFGNPDWM